MSAIGGSITGLSISGREFTVVADNDSQRKVGGAENELLPNGNGTARVKQTVVPWSISGLVIEIDDSREDQEFLQNLVDAGAFFPVAVTYASGVVYQGSGQIVGEIPGSAQNASGQLALSGPGKLTPQ